jgi:hypothetical protein
MGKSLVKVAKAVEKKRFREAESNRLFMEWGFEWRGNLFG